MAASTRDIRLPRIKSVKNTAQITKAMQMVASSKMRKAQLAALSGRPYAKLMNRVLADVTANALDFSHEFMERREVRKRCVICWSARTRGLCGALNSNLTREAAKFDPKDTTVYVCGGQEGRAVCGPQQAQPDRGIRPTRITPQFAEARAVSKFCPWTCS